MQYFYITFEMYSDILRIQREKKKKYIKVKRKTSLEASLIIILLMPELWKRISQNGGEKFDTIFA